MSTRVNLFVKNDADWAALVACQLLIYSVSSSIASKSIVSFGFSDNSKIVDQLKKYGKIAFNDIYSNTETRQLSSPITLSFNDTLCMSVVNQDINYTYCNDNGIPDVDDIMEKGIIVLIGDWDKLPDLTTLTNDNKIIIISSNVYSDCVQTCANDIAADANIIQISSPATMLLRNVGRGSELLSIDKKLTNYDLSVSGAYLVSIKECTSSLVSLATTNNDAVNYSVSNEQKMFSVFFPEKGGYFTTINIVSKTPNINISSWSRLEFYAKSSAVLETLLTQDCVIDDKTTTKESIEHIFRIGESSCTEVFSGCYKYIINYKYNAARLYAYYALVVDYGS